jgi:hypothetical protein
MHALLLETVAREIFPEKRQIQGSLLGASRSKEPRNFQADLLAERCLAIVPFWGARTTSFCSTLHIRTCRQVGKKRGKGSGVSLSHHQIQ